MSDKLLSDKNPVISFHVVEDGVHPMEDADGSLVIDTSEGHQVTETQLIITTLAEFVFRLEKRLTL